MDAIVRFQSFVVAGLLACQALLLAAAAAKHGPIMDDVAHLAAGISNWQIGRFDLYKVNPPLVRMLAALPVMLAGPATDYRRYSKGVGARPEFAVMDDFTEANGPRVIWLVALARFGLIPLALLGGYVSYRWARELYGDVAGLVALALWCFCPNVLAYAQLLAADLGAASLGVSASYLFWKWLTRPTWGRALAAGVVLGLAELTKTTWLVLFALWPALFLVWEWHPSAFGRRRGADHDLCFHSLQLAMISGLGLLCINMGYDFEGIGKPLREYAFVSRPLAGDADAGATRYGNRFAGSRLGHLPVPLPRNYVEGIDLQWHDIEMGKPSYLHGRWQDRGWWYWYFYALAVKIPLGTWGLLALAVAVRLSGWTAKLPSKKGSPSLMLGHPHSLPLERGGGSGAAPFLYRPTWRDEFILLAPAVAVMILVSSQTGFSRYLRYVLPIVPYGFIWIGGAARNIKWRTALAMASLLAWSVGSSLWYAPHWMSYFNELAGGPLGGPRHLLDAQVDWGQDLLYLKKWQDAHPDARPLRLAFLGPIDPRLAGVEFKLPPKAEHVLRDCAAIAQVPTGLQPGWYAVSVNLLYGCPYFVRDAQGGRIQLDRAYYSYFRRFQPSATAGYSIYIYHLSQKDIHAASNYADARR